MVKFDRRTFLTRSTAFGTVFAAERGLMLPTLGQAPVNAVGRGADHPFFKNVKRPEVIAHRGGNGQWPGETMYAYKKAAEIGVDILETDVYLTKDRRLVLMHDNNISSTTNYVGQRKELELHNFTMAELKTLNAAYNWTPMNSGKMPFRNDSTKDLKVTSLEELLVEMKGIRINIEMKSAAAGYAPTEELARLICSIGIKEKVLVASLRHAYLSEFRRLCPDVATSASPLELARFEASSLSGGHYRPDTDAIQRPIFGIGRKVIDNAHCAAVKSENSGACRRLPMHVWTVNELENMQRAIDLGVDGIITDYPGPLLALLQRSPGSGCK